MRANVLRRNSGHGAALYGTSVTALGNDLLSNGRAGMFLFQQSQADAADNLFAGNGGPGIEVTEGSSATLRRNRFDEGPGPSIEQWCADPGRRGVASLGEGNTFAGRKRPSTCL